MKRVLSGYSRLRSVAQVSHLVTSLFFFMVLWSGLIQAQVHEQPQMMPVHEPMRVFVSVLPQKYLVERIAGDLARVDVMVGPGKSPETYEPSPKQMARLANASLYFSISVPFEKVWMPRIKELNQALIIIDPAYTGKEAHSDDPHLWTSPVEALKIAQQMRDGLITADPKNMKVYLNNFSYLQRDLENLHMEIQTLMQSSTELQRRSFLVMHPAWGSFAKTYDLEQVALEHEGKEPTGKELAELIQWAKKQKVQAIFIQKQHSIHMAHNIADEIGAKIVKLDPLAEDYINNLRNVAVKIAESFKR